MGICVPIVIHDLLRAWISFHAFKAISAHYQVFTALGALTNLAHINHMIREFFGAHKSGFG
jgi:hypothetical protein